MEFNENRRKARSVLNYLQLVSGEMESGLPLEEDARVSNFYSAKKMLLGIDGIPLSLKAEIRDNPNVVWEKTAEITDILKKICEEQSQNEKLQEFENADDSNKQFLDAMADFFDEAIPENLKTQFTSEQQEDFSFLCNQVGSEKLDFIKTHEGLVEDTLEMFIQVLSEDNYAEKIMLIDDFNTRMDEVLLTEDLLLPFAQGCSIGMNELFHKKGFAELQKYAKLVERQKEIRELAEMIGQQLSDEKETDRQARSSITHIESQFHPKPSFRGNIAGFSYSGDISKVVPTEMALLKNPATEMLFYHKFAEKQLLSYNYVQQEPLNEVRRKKKGPIIMAVDTSGSMEGNPEKIAKSVAFAITKIALKEKRKCFLISFSSGISVLDLSNMSDSSGLDKLTEFLSCSFEGGTDIEPCVSAALDQLENRNFKDADILVISDFMMPDLNPGTVTRIEAQKKNGTKFYSLLIVNQDLLQFLKLFSDGDESFKNQNVLSYFDEQWEYQATKGQQMTFLHTIK